MRSDGEGNGVLPLTAGTPHGIVRLYVSGRATHLCLLPCYMPWYCCSWTNQEGRCLPSPMCSSSLGHPLCRFMLSVPAGALSIRPGRMKFFFFFFYSLRRRGQLPDCRPPWSSRVSPGRCRQPFGTGWLTFGEPHLTMSSMPLPNPVTWRHNTHLTCRPRRSWAVVHSKAHIPRKEPPAPIPLEQFEERLCVAFV